MITNNDRHRLLALSFFIFILFSLLVIQFFRIQIIEGEKWSKEARKQHFFIIKEPFLRGTFFTNTSVKKKHLEKPQKLVVEIEKFHLYIDPISIPETCRKTIISSLLSKLDLSATEQLNFRKQFYRKSRSRKLAMWLDQEVQNNILEWWLPYAKKNHIPRNALYFVTDYQRSYPFGKLLGQVLHTTQSIKDEKTGQAIPTGGLELYFNSYLKGKLGKRRLMRSPRNALEIGEVLQQPENGADLYLTINHCLQAIAEEELAKGVKKAKASAGWAVMMDPYSGEILALAQYPFFYPPDCQSYFNNKELIQHTRVRAVTDANEPGSVMKPFIMAVALKANEELQARGEAVLFSPLEKMATSNGHFKGRSKPLTDTHLHPYLNMEMAIQKSSNIYVARLVERIINRLGKEWFREQLQTLFGFGKKAGIELPAESAGVLPMPGKKHPNGTFEWSASTPYSMAIGHNIQMTSIQLARAYAVFANGGRLVKPTVIRKIVKNEGNENQKILLDNTLLERVQAFPTVLEKDNIAAVVRAMKYVTKTGGTASRANVWGYTEAGKTGTANKIVNGTYAQDKYCSTFVGFVPTTKPAFVLLVTLDEPEYGYIPGVGKNHHGGTCVAPIFREIATRSLEYLGVEPDDPFGYPTGDPRCNKEKADWMKETQQLQEMYESWNKIVKK